MKNKSLILSLLLVLVALVLSVFGVNVKAAGNESEALSIEGVQIREAEGEVVSGMRFVAETNGYTPAGEVTAYGVSIAFGEAEAAEITIGATVNGKSVLSAQVSETIENIYYINLIDIPTTMYGQKVTARSYVVDNGEVVYSSTAVTKCYGQAALDITAAGKDKETTKAIVAELAANYKSVRIDANNNVFVDSAIYETNPANLEVEFLKDWNAKFGTSLTDVTIANFYDLGKAGYSTVNDTDPSVGNYFKFFRDSANGYEAKWSWLLEYFASVDDTVHVKNQANAILSYDVETNTNNNTQKMYYNDHLTCALSNFFNGQAGKKGYTGLDFTGPKRYATLGAFNDVILSKNASLVAVDSTLALESLTPATGYTFDGYKATEIYNDSYTITADSVVLVPQYTAIKYNITFFNESEELTDLANTYTVKDEVELPELNIEGYDFLGWYEDPTFAGEAVVTIAAGTTGNKVYYARLEVKLFEEVNVTFNANGGLILPADADIPSTFTFEVSSYNNNGSTPTYMLDNGTGNTLRYQYKILLKYNSEYDVYEVVTVDAAKKSLTDAANDAGVTWTHAIADSAHNITTYVTVGQLIYINKTALQNGTAQVAKVYNSLDEFEQFSTQLKEPVALPIPVKDGYKFVGWKSSLDGSVVTEYFGYNENPGDITYTAQWESTFTVTLKLDGGNLLYSTYDELIADYTADYKTLTKQTSFSVWKGTVTALGDMFRNSNKWDWLLDYWAAVNTNSYNGTTNASVFNTMKETGECADYYYFSVEMTAFGTSSTGSVYSGNLKSADYSQESVRNQAWTYLSASLETPIICAETYILPEVAYKAGYTFDGWYTSSTFEAGTKVTSVNANTTVYAKWVEAAE